MFYFINCMHHSIINKDFNTITVLSPTVTDPCNGNQCTDVCDSETGLCTCQDNYVVSGTDCIGKKYVVSVKSSLIVCIAM